MSLAMETINEDPGLGGMSRQLHLLANKLATTATYEQKRNPYFLALHAPKLLEKSPDGQIINEPKAILAIAGILTKVAYDCGQTIAGDITFELDGQPVSISNLEMLCKSMIIEVNTIFPNCTVEELRLALNNYVRGEYGEFKGGLNIVQFNHAIRSFIRSNARMQVKRENALPPPMQKSDPEAEELKYKDWVRKQFNRYKETGVIEFIFPSHQFKQMEKWGLIKITPDEKRAMIPAGKAKLWEAKKAARLQADRKERQTIEGVLKRMEIGEMNNHDEQELWHECRKLAIKIYYDSITELPKF